MLSREGDRMDPGDNDDDQIGKEDQPVTELAKEPGLLASTARGRNESNLFSGQVP
jgi:hypothetical protein